MDLLAWLRLHRCISAQSSTEPGRQQAEFALGGPVHPSRTCTETCTTSPGRKYVLFSVSVTRRAMPPAGQPPPRSAALSGVRGGIGLLGRVCASAGLCATVCVRRCRAAECVGSGVGEGQRGRRTAKNDRQLVRVMLSDDEADDDWDVEAAFEAELAALERAERERDAGQASSQPSFLAALGTGETPWTLNQGGERSKGPQAARMGEPRPSDFAVCCPACAAAALVTGLPSHPRTQPHTYERQFGHQAGLACSLAGPFRPWPKLRTRLSLCRRGRALRG
jgi:hypothetical protein